MAAQKLPLPNQPNNISAIFSESLKVSGGIEGDFVKKMPLLATNMRRHLIS